MSVWVLLAACAMTHCVTLVGSSSPSTVVDERVAAAVLTSLGVRQVVVLAPFHLRRRHHPNHIGGSRLAGERTEEVVQSLCAEGIQVSLSELPISAATSPSNRREDNERPSRPLEAPSLHGRGKQEPQHSIPPTEAFPTTRSGGAGKRAPQVAAKDGSKGTEGNNTKAVEEEAARIFKDLVLHTGGAGSTFYGVLVMGEASWVTAAAVWMNQKTLLGPNEILLLHCTSGRVTKSLLVPHIRLTSKVVVLERNEIDPANGSAGGSKNKSSLSSSPCSFFIHSAQLLDGGTDTLRTVGCWLRERRLLLRQPLLQDIESLRGAHAAIVIIKDFFEAIRVGPRRAHLVGYLGNVINDLAFNLDFHYTILEGTSFGTKSANGSYDGIIGHTERREGELGLASLSITHGRYQAIDFTTWLRFQPSLFVTRGSRYLKDPMAVFRPYSWQMWMLIIVFLVFSATWIWLLWSFRVSVSGGRSATRRREKFEKLVIMRPTFMSVVTIVFKAIVSQGSSHLPRGHSGRFVYASTLVVVVVLVGVFSGNLTAFLFRPVLSRPPATIQELVTYDWTIRLDKAYGSHDLIKETKTKNYQTLYRRAAQRGAIIENQGATTRTKTKIEDILSLDIALVMGEPGAFHTLNENTKADGGCLLTYGRETIGLEYAALAAPKKSLLKPLFDKNCCACSTCGRRD